VVFAAENWTMDEIAIKLPHIRPGGEHSPSYCKPKYNSIQFNSVQFSSIQFSSI
jgi:hypothetical protein